MLLAGNSAKCWGQSEVANQWKNEEDVGERMLNGIKGIDGLTRELKFVFQRENEQWPIKDLSRVEVPTREISNWQLLQSIAMVILVEHHQPSGATACLPACLPPARLLCSSECV